MPSSTRQYPHSIRNRRAFEAWYSEGRKVTAAVLIAAGLKTREALYKMRDEQGWKTFADQLDSEQTEQIAVASQQRMAIVLSAKDQHITEMEALLTAGRRVLTHKMRHMLRKVDGNIDDLPTGEHLEWLRGLAIVEAVGRELFHLAQPLRVDVNVNPQRLAELRQQVAPLLELAEQNGMQLDLVA